VSDRARNNFVLAFVTALVIVSLIITVGIPGVVKAKKTHLGLDLNGGVELIYQARPGATTKVDATSVNNAISVIRQRVDQIGVSEPSITASGSNQIDVSLPNAKNQAQAQAVVGKTGELFFYDWEDSVITGPNGKIAGPNDSAATGGQSPGLTGYLTEYKAVVLGSKQKPVTKPAKGTYQSAPQGSYYYVLDAKKRVIAGPESAPTKAQALGFLQSDLAQHNKKLPAGARLVFVPPGTVLVQATSTPEKGIPDAYYVLKDSAFLTGNQISNPQATTDPTQGVVVSFGFKGGASGVFEAMTQRLSTRGKDNSVINGTANDQHFVVTLDNQIVTAPSIDYTQFPNGIPSGNGSEITNIGSYSTATQLANVMASGALPLKLDLIASNTVSATLGHAALNQGLVAGLVGLLLVAVFLLVFYRVLGVIAVVALAVYALYFYALIKLVPVTLTLPGIAGLILTIGVAADANVVIFERVKEEARAGRSPLNAILNGYRRGFAAIVDANVVTFMTAFILFVLSQADVQGFALTLGVGVLVSLFTAVAATRAVLGTMGRTRVIGRPSALGVGERRRRWTFDFMGNSRWFFTLSGTILLVGAIAIGARGLNFGIDFVSGSQVQVSLARHATQAQVVSAVESLGLRSGKQTIGVPTVQQISNTNKSKRVANSFQISTKTLRPDQIGSASAPSSQPGSIAYVLNRHWGLRDLNSTSVGPSFGRTVENSAVVAIIASLLAISVYIALRFNWKYAVPVLIALMHDLLITSGVYALTGREVTASTVAALLTILGYSLYDTIIVFDRVRENVQKMQNAAFSQIVNRSMSEVLTRSLATSLCTLLPILALLIFGGSTLKDFAFALLVGVASGAYSSIFIASPVLTHWKEREPVYRRRRARIAAENGGQVPAYATSGAAARETEIVERRRSRRLTGPGAGDGTVSAGEFADLVRELHTEPEPRGHPEPRRPRRAEPRAAASPPPRREPQPPPEAPPPPPVADPTADARPEDVVMPQQPRTPPRGQGGSKSRGRRRGRPR
jgi:SecD/SecF fusion protein